MLTIIILLPIFGAILLGFLKEEQSIRFWSLFFTIITFMFSLVLWNTFDMSSIFFQYTNSFIGQYLNFSLGLDSMSIYFVLLTTFTLPICVLASWVNIKNHVNLFFLYLLLLEGLLICLFCVNDLLLFYVFFEAVLIPLFLIVGTWGSSAPEERRRASTILFLYTFFGSLFILLAFLVIFSHVGSTDFKVLSLVDISFGSQVYLFLAIFLSFAIKQPLIPFHIWLNKAHAEAPLAGSMILAGLILKLATYGFFKVILPFFPETSNFFSPDIQFLAIFTLIFSSFTTLRQLDLKQAIAYSSVSHMALVLAGLFSNSTQGIEGGFLLSIAHGLTSPALFLCIGLIYDRFHVRNISYYRGLILTMPVFSAIFFLFILANAGTPLTASFVGEFLSVLGAFDHSPIVGLFLVSGVVLSAAYSFWIYNRVSGGQSSIYLDYHLDITRREFMCFLPFIFFTFLLGILPSFITSDIAFQVSTLITDTGIKI